MAKLKMTNEIKFIVQGSAPAPYHVLFKKNGTNLMASCTCPAGIVGQYCKHRIRIIFGDPSGIISDNLSDVSEIQNWVRGTDVEKAFLLLQEAEQQLEEAKKQVSLSKKRLARVMRDYKEGDIK
jgi:hypothetical protein